MTKDTCRHCGIDGERTEELTVSARETGGFLCPGCLAGYRALSGAPASGEHRASRAPDPAFVEAARRRFDPETPEQREAFWQKIGAVREGK